MKIGIDIGGTNSVFGIVDDCGNVLSTASLKTAAYETAEDFTAAALSVINNLLATVPNSREGLGIGIAAPNANHYTGEICSAPNIAWAHDKNVPLVRLMEEATGLPCAITNDANAAALGEKKYGAGKDFKDFIMITLGTGLGSGIIANNEILYGRNGLAGELGHVYRQEAADRLCGCGRKGYLETICSATGVARTARKMLEESNEPSLLRSLKPEEINSYEVSKAAEKGDKLSKAVYDFTGEVLGKACADFATFLSPEAFIFFGGMAKSGELLMKPLRKAYAENAMPCFRDVQLLTSNIDGGNAAVIGAAAVAG